MEKDYRRISHVAFARADMLSERAIFWGLVVTVIAIPFAMLKGMHW